MLRITTTTDKGSPMLKLEGRVGGPWVDELRRSWSVAAERNGAKSVKVDMRGVSYVDRRGADLLMQMEGEGTHLAQCSDFIRELLRGSGSGERNARRKKDKASEKENENASTLRSRNHR